VTARRIHLDISDPDERQFAAVFALAFAGAVIALG